MLLKIQQRSRELSCREGDWRSLLINDFSVQPLLPTESNQRDFSFSEYSNAAALGKVLLSKLITTCIRSVLEYACQVWNFNSPDYLKEETERIQKRALPITYHTAQFQKSNDISPYRGYFLREEIIYVNHISRNFLIQNIS